MQLYKTDLISDFGRQLFSFRTLLNSCDIKIIKDLVIFILQNDFCTTSNDILSAYLIYLTLPVTAATAERSFFKLKLIKKYLRNSTGQYRLGT